MRLIAGFAECLDNFESPYRADTTLTADFLQFLTQFPAHFFQIKFFQQSFDGFSTHTDFKMRTIFLIIVAIFFFGEQLPPHQRSIFGIQYNICGEIEDFLQRTGRDVQDQAHSTGDSFEIPDMRHWRRKVNMTHTVPADFGFGDFNTATVANYAFMTNPFVFSAVTFPVTGWSENFLAK